MARQKQVDDCIGRCLARQPPVPKSKLSASLVGKELTLHHYHHKVLVYSLEDRKVLHEWWEKPTDKRILEAALAYLRDSLAPKSAATPSGSTGVTQLAAKRKQSISTERLTHGPLNNCRLAHGEPIKDRGSVFIAHAVFPITSEAMATSAIALVRRHDSASSATHNISAFRIAGASAGFSTGHFDDGEAGAGAKLLKALNEEQAVNVVVVVSRWFGGVNLGQARFQHVSKAARDLLQLCGHRPGVPLTEELRELGVGRTLGSSSTGSSSAAAAPPAGSATSSAGDARARREAAAAAAERRMSMAKLRGSAAAGVLERSCGEMQLQGALGQPAPSGAQTTQVEEPPRKAPRVEQQPPLVPPNDSSTGRPCDAGPRVWRGLSKEAAAIELDD